MIFRDALREGRKLIEASGGDTPYLDAVVLLAAAACISKERLYASLTDLLPPPAEERYRELVRRRGEGIPVAYLTHCKEFYGREFYVDERVLIPRSDTETLVETALAVAAEEAAIKRVHDLGTGTGCIALTLKAERADLEISASDSSHAACEVFTINAERLGLDVQLSETSFFESLRGPFDMVVSNPPYVSDTEAGQMLDAGWPEPQEALRGGSAGLDHIAQIIDESVHFLREGGRLLLEASPAQVPEIRKLMQEAGYGGLAATADLAGRDRVVSGMKNG